MPLLPCRCSMQLIKAKVRVTFICLAHFTENMLYNIEIPPHENIYAGVKSACRDKINWGK